MVGKRHAGPDAGGRGAERPRQSDAVEEESDDEGGGDSTDVKQFVWDSAKGMLVSAPTVAREQGGDGARKAAEADSIDRAEAGQDGVAPDAGAHGQDGKEGAKGGESSEEESGDAEDTDLEAESRTEFLNSASMPELIKQAVAIGGAMAEGVTDRWALDVSTKLYFRFDSASRKIHCWNPEQGCIYVWRERGKMDFLWASPNGPSAQPPPGAPSSGPVLSAPKPAAALPTLANATESLPASSTIAAAKPSEALTPAQAMQLLVTVLPPAVLRVGGVVNPGDKVTEEIELSAKGFAGVAGKDQVGLKELEKFCGATAQQMEQREGETLQRLRLEGTRAQISAAKAMIEQKVVVSLGEKKAEKMQKHVNSELLERKRHESGADAAKVGVKGLSDFVQKWELKNVMARKLARLDAMLQRYMIRHFEPRKAKPANALRAYVVALLKHPQRWRLEALYEDGELDGEVCETTPVGPKGALVGRQREPGEVETEPVELGEQFIELEVSSAFVGREASQIFGDVQGRHCRLFQMGSDFYACAFESQIGTVVDGHKYREHDGPVAIRDGTVIGVGKYLLYCEVGDAAALQQRRKRLLDGLGFWKEGVQTVDAAEREEVEGGTEAVVAADYVDSDGDEAEGDDAPRDGMSVDEADASPSGTKRKRDEDLGDAAVGIPLDKS